MITSPAKMMGRHRRDIKNKLMKNVQNYVEQKMKEFDEAFPSGGKGILFSASAIAYGSTETRARAGEIKRFLRSALTSVLTEVTQDK